MSQMDAVVSASALVAQAAKWGHPAIAITDHANVQSFPDAYNAGKKHGIKVLFGLEINLVDDGVPIVYEEQHRLLETDTYVRIRRGDDRIVSCIRYDYRACSCDE